MAESKATHLGPGGRVVVPASWRKTHGIKPGDRLVWEVVDGRLTLVPYSQVVAEVQSWFQQHMPKLSSEDMIAWKREEARLEDEKWDRI